MVQEKENAEVELNDEKACRDKFEAAGCEDELELSSQWQDWVIENALEGATVADLVDDICEVTDDRATVENEVIRLCTSAGFRAAQAWRRRALRFKKVNALRVAFHRGHGPKTIERRTNISSEELRSRFLRFGQPVVLTDIASSSPALQKWTDAYFIEKLGTLDVQFCKGRELQDNPNINIERFFQNAPLAEVIEQIANAGVSNDLYLSGNNGFFGKPQTHFLIEDLDKNLEKYLDSQGLTPKRISFWMGPAGTCTALHHDPASVLYVQIRGQKRFRMLAPSNEAALMSAVRTYPDVELKQAAKNAGDRIYEVTLSPGEAMLLPAGWWHEVTALSPSISLSITNLKGPCSFSWYTPGELGNEQVSLGSSQL